ncbi:YopJ family acetyltransferase [Pandoraea pneumonica]
MHPISHWSLTRSVSLPAPVPGAAQDDGPRRVSPPNHFPFAEIRSAIDASGPEALRYSFPRTLHAYYNFAVSFLSADKQCPSMACVDGKFLPQLIASECARRPGMRASYFEYPEALVEHILQRYRLPEAEGREQGVVNMGADGIHFAAFDLAFFDAQPSVILLESGSMNGEGASKLAIRLCQALAHHKPAGFDWPNRNLLIFETRTQQSAIDCGIFSLVACTTMFKQASTFESLHRRLRAGEFDDAVEFHHLSFKQSDALLPPSIMRHTQSRGRLADYVRRHSCTTAEEAAEMRHIVDRQRDHVCHRERRSYSVSIEMERIKISGRALPPLPESADLLEETFLREIDDRPDTAAASPHPASLEKPSR